MRDGNAISRALLALASAFLLAGCFMSDQPLIAPAESVAPIKPGTYAEFDTADPASQSSQRLSVSVKGTTTVFKESTSALETDSEGLLARKLRAAYYVGMLLLPNVHDAEGNLYSLFRIDDDGFTTFDESGACGNLETLAAAKNVPVTQFGVVRVKTGPKKAGQAFGSDSCYFAGYAGLAKAYGALLDAGALHPDKTYRRAP